MRIIKIETFSIPLVGLLRLTTDSGETGWGQIATYEAADIVARTLHRQVAGCVLGRDPFEQEQINESVLDTTMKFPGSYMCRSLAAIDTALWDLKGQIEKKPVWELLGGSADPVPVYGSSMSRSIAPDDEAARMVRLRDTAGYQAYKVRVGTPTGHNQDAWPGRSEALIPTVRKALGDDITIHADANSCYTPGRALEIGRLLEDNHYGHFEEPCPYWELDWTKQVTSKLVMPVAGGEQDNSMPVWRQMIREHVVDIIQPDICYAGGISRTVNIAGLAAEYGLPCVPHSSSHSLVTVFTLHLWNAMPNNGPFMEFSIEGQEKFHTMFSPALEAVDGSVPIPDEGCGWGVSIENEWLEDSEYLVSEE